MRQKNRKLKFGKLTAAFLLSVFSFQFCYAQSSKTPIYNGILQSDLNAAGYKILSANLSDYAGSGMSWNAVTGKFDTTGGGGGGTPGGTTTQLQRNNAGAFAGTSGGTATATQVTLVNPNMSSDPGASGRNTVSLINTNATSKSSQLTFYSSATPLWSVGNDTLTNGFQNFYIYENVNGVSRLYLDSNGITLPANGYLGWASATNGVLLTADTGIRRKSAGVVTMAILDLDTNLKIGGDRLCPQRRWRLQINNGTAGTYRDLIVRNITINGSCTGAGCGSSGGGNVSNSGTPGAGQFAVWTDATHIKGNPPGNLGYNLRSDGTNVGAYPGQLVNSSTATVSAGYVADTYLTGSSVVIAAGDFKQKGQYHCIFDMVKTAAGTATPIVTVRIGTAGTTADTGLITFTFAAGTAAVDTERLMSG
jgi:hypothetical protein